MAKCNHIPVLVVAKLRYMGYIQLFEYECSPSDLQDAVHLCCDSEGWLNMQGVCDHNLMREMSMEVSTLAVLIRCVE
eukprot:1158216-Pelagomonas_calceolata.AAC.3